MQISLFDFYYRFSVNFLVLRRHEPPKTYKLLIVVAYVHIWMFDQYMRQPDVQGSKSIDSCPKPAHSFVLVI